ncbi:MAG: hypothetical protein LKM44_02535 [Wolbachia endosymbiont of Meromenopon meropis]|nr:hypothetical protein [Wolbachia endosymbiont of Meromenopon meropis]
MISVPSTSQIEKNDFSELFTQLDSGNGGDLKKRKHRLIYRAFLNTLENPEKQARQKMRRISEKLQEEFPEEQKQKLLADLNLLDEQVSRLQSENEKKFFAFVFQNRVEIFNDINKRIRPLSGENFLQFLISVFKKIREKKIAGEENLENEKITEIVDNCLIDARGKEARDSLMKFVTWPFGIRIDFKNISDSLMSELKKKVSFLNSNKKEGGAQLLSDEEMVVIFLRKSLFPVIFFTFAALVFNTGLIMVSIGTVGLLFNEVNQIKDLFSNKRGSILCKSQIEEEKEWNDEVNARINEILKILIFKEVQKDDKFTVMSSMKLIQENEKQPSVILEQVNIEDVKDFLKNEKSYEFERLL